MFFTYNPFRPIGLKGFLMNKTLVKISALVLLITSVIGLCACFEDIDSSKGSASVVTGTEEKSFKRLSFDYDLYPYFATLTEKEKDIYSLLFEELYKGSQKFECRVEANADDLSKSIDAVLNDHPELFWLDNKYSYTYDPDDGSIKEITFDFYDFADTPEKLHKAKVDMEAKADIVISETRSKTTMVERELYIHDYICQNTAYDETAPYNQSAYSCLILNKSVCAGYARAFQYLMSRAGFICYYVAGRTEGLNGQIIGGSDEGGSHSWNMVVIEGSYYNVDCLWDDTASDTYGSAIYPFFNLTDEAFIYHVRNSMAAGLPKCNGTKYKYSNCFGKTVEAESIVFVDAT